MRKRLTAILTAILCTASPVTAIPVCAEADPNACTVIGLDADSVYLSNGCVLDQSAFLEYSGADHPLEYGDVLTVSAVIEPIAPGQYVLDEETEIIYHGTCADYYTVKELTLTNKTANGTTLTFSDEEGASYKWSTMIVALDDFDYTALVDPIGIPVGDTVPCAVKTVPYYVDGEEYFREDVVLPLIYDGALPELPIDHDADYILETDTFRYANNRSYSNQCGFFLRSELADPDFMVLGFQYYADDPEKIYGYVVCPVNTGYWGDNGIGVIHHQTIGEQIGNAELQVGDLLRYDGMIEAASIYPTYYSPPAEAGELSYIGNGVELFGEEFRTVIRWQTAIEQAAYDARKSMIGAHYDINICDLSAIRGDINEDNEVDILDCIAVNKSLLAGAPMSDYAKAAGDVNGNHTIDADDALLILKRTIGLIG